MTTQLITRAEAGLRAARSTPAPITARMLTAHWGGPSPWGAGGIGDHSRCASIWRAWQSFHLDSRGWSDIAYSSGVCPHGVRFEGRGPGRRTAANGTDAGNAASLATCYIAGEGNPLTDAAKLAYLDEAARFGVPLLRSHRDWKPTSCAGDELTRWVHAGCPRPGGQVPVAPAAPIVIPPPVHQPEEFEMFLRNPKTEEIFAFGINTYQRFTLVQFKRRYKEGAPTVIDDVSGGGIIFALAVSRADVSAMVPA